MFGVFMICLPYLMELLPGCSCATQVDVRLSPSDFFLGEQFVVTAFQRKMDELEGDEEEDERNNRVRGARSVEGKKYPSRNQQRILAAIHTDPSNYLAEETANSQDRRGRLIGSRRLPTGLEPHLLKDLSVDQANDFDNLQDGKQRQPRLVLGPRWYPLWMQDRFIKPIDDDIGNTLVQGDSY